jgi:hypothetical protein
MVEKRSRTMARGEETARGAGWVAHYVVEIRFRKLGAALNLVDWRMGQLSGLNHFTIPCCATWRA